MLPSFQAGATVWKATGELGLTTVYAQLDDSTNPAQVQVRVENHSQLAGLKISRNFVQLLDAEGLRQQPCPADELVGDKLEKLREWLPQYAREINQLLSEIRADYPQQKIVEVYGRLQSYLDQGRPMEWRTQLENLLLAKRPSKPEEIQAARLEVASIGELAKNYLWVNELAPDSQVTGVLYFERPTKLPPQIYFQVGERFLGMRMALASPK